MEFTEKAVKQADQSIQNYRWRLYRIAGLIAKKEGKQVITEKHIIAAEETIK